MQLVFLTVTLVVRAFFELLGVASIAPFMAVVTDPSAIAANPWLDWVYHQFSFKSNATFLVSMGIAVILLLIICNSISAITQYALLRFSWNTNHRLSVRLLTGYLSQPYSFFTKTNTSTLSNSILIEVSQVINGVLTPALNIVSRSLVTVALITLLFLTDLSLALIITVVLGGLYSGFYLMVRERQKQSGLRRVEANKSRFKITGESFGGIKDVKVLAREGAFVARFVPASLRFSKASAFNAVISQIPRYVFETIAFGGIISITLYYLRSGKPISQVLPTISLYTLAGYRLMPELQQLFSGLAAIRFSSASLDSLCDDLQRFPIGIRTASTETGRLTFECGIELSKVTFCYPDTPSPAINNVSLSIKRNQTIGLVGASGSGKTTLADVLLGLYTPERGEILIDGIPLTEELLPSWRKSIGYVPQQIFLCDDTIANNIAFGVPKSKIDQGRVVTATQMAHLHEFISTLPDGYETIVGERGVRLSGGQRQRIGIARALYQDPEILIMDEATSALDGATEGVVMEAIQELSGQKTIVLIAHRLSTVQHCDTIFMLDDGQLKWQGNYAELCASSNEFRSLAKLSSGQ